MTNDSKVWEITPQMISYSRRPAFILAGLWRNQPSWSQDNYRVQVPWCESKIFTIQHRIPWYSDYWTHGRLPPSRLMLPTKKPSPGFATKRWEKRVDLMSSSLMWVNMIFTMDWTPFSRVLEIWLTLPTRRGLLQEFHCSPLRQKCSCGLWRLTLFRTSKITTEIYGSVNWMFLRSKVHSWLWNTLQKQWCRSTRPVERTSVVGVSFSQPPLQVYVQVQEP